MTEKPLTDQQLQFCVNVIANGGNGTAAAEAAGYAHAGARVRAHRLLELPRIQAKIAELTARAAQEATQQLEAAGVAAIAEQAITTEAQKSSIELAVESLKERVLKRLESLGLTELPEIATWDTDTVKFVPSDQLSATARGSVQSVKAEMNEVISDEGDKILRRTTMEVKQHNPMPALRELMKLVGLEPRDEKGKTTVAVGVQVIVSGGPTGIEAGIAPETLIVAPNPPIAAEKGEIVPENAQSGSPAPRPWRPGPRKKGLSAVAAAARAALVAP